MKPERYFSVDIESAGPIPGKYSMLSLGACVVGNPDEAFYVELKPISKDFVPDALKISGFDLNRLEKDGESPDKAMKTFRRWVETASVDHRLLIIYEQTTSWSAKIYIETKAGSRIKTTA